MLARDWPKNPEARMNKQKLLAEEGMLDAASSIRIAVNSRPSFREIEAANEGLDHLISDHRRLTEAIASAEPICGLCVICRRDTGKHAENCIFLEVTNGLR